MPSNPLIKIFYIYAPMYGYHVSASAAMYRRAINHKLYADTYIKPPVYRTNLLAGKNPWFDSYEDYSEDIRRIAKDYTVLPEFRISDHMDFYLNNQSASFVGTNNKFLSLDGAAHTSSAEGEFAAFDENFFKTYSNSEFIFIDPIQEDLKIDHLSFVVFALSIIKSIGKSKNIFLLGKKIICFNDYFRQYSTIGNIDVSDVKQSFYKYIDVVIQWNIGAPDENKLLIRLLRRFVLIPIWRLIKLYIKNLNTYERN